MDRYAALRFALAAGPTDGPWQSTDNSWETSSVDASDTTVARCEIDGRVDEDTQEKYERIKSVDARYIAAADPATIAELLRELDEIKTLVARLKQEAQIHSQEARTANATIAEIYQAISGSTGEPGNWNGAEPVRKLVAERDALRAFAQDMMSRWPECGIDGDELERAAIKHELVRMRQCTTPCRPECSCTDYYEQDEFAAGIDCYRRTKLLTGKADE